MSNVSRLGDYQKKAPSSQPDLKGGSGDGTFDGMEARVTALEKRLDKFEGKLDTLISSVAELKGRVSASPTTWQLLGIMITTWAAGAAIVFALTRAVR